MKICKDENMTSSNFRMCEEIAEEIAPLIPQHKNSNPLDKHRKFGLVGRA